MNTQRDNIKAGLFVLAGLVLGLVVVYTLSDLKHLLEKKQGASVYFPLSEGVQGLRAGAAVTLGDQPVGEVTAIEDVVRETPAGDVIHGKRVRFSIPKRYQLYWDASIELVVPTIGTGTRLNIRSVGTGPPYDPEAPMPGDLTGERIPQDLELPPGTMVGAPPSSALTRSLGIEDEQRRQIKDIVANVHELSEKMKVDIPEITASARRTLERIEPLTEDAATVMADLKASAADVRATVADARAIAADAREQSKVWFARIDRMTTSAERALATADKLLEEKDPDLRRIVDNVRAVTEDVRTRTLVQVTTALEKADTALENLQVATSELRTFAVGQRPVLERAVANFQITSAQLKLAAIEVRRSPWRLLYTPKDEELEYDNLYDAARSFALAASALDASARSLRAVTEQKAATPEQLDRMLDHLEKLFSRFQETESKFWSALEAKAGGASPGE